VMAPNSKSFFLSLVYVGEKCFTGLVVVVYG